jgi:hypothetical protein
MIQQVIRCDICGSQKRQSNHWFVVCELSGGLHIGPWTSPHLLSPDTKHLCGETCAHKLISHFLTKLMDGGMPRFIDKSDGTPAREAAIRKGTDCEESAITEWNDSTGTTNASRSPRSTPRDMERLQRPNPCVGSRRS